MSADTLLNGGGASAPLAATTIACPRCRMPFGPLGISRDHGRDFAVSPCCGEVAWLDELHDDDAVQLDYMSAEAICRAAATLVSGARAATHGDTVTNHVCIAELWNAYLLARHVADAGPLTADAVADMMELLKVARRLTGTYNPDDYTDGAGYAAVAGEIRSRANAIP